MQEKQLTNLTDFHMPRWNELPNVDLYLDQVVGFVNTNLSISASISTNNKDAKESQLLTKTMINNYVKNNLLDAPIKKKYSKIQLAKLFAICILKQVYSMNDINVLINIALDNADVETTYNHFCNYFEEALVNTFEHKEMEYNKLKDNKQYLLKAVLYSCSYKIYVQTITLNKQSYLNIK